LFYNRAFSKKKKLEVSVKVFHLSKPAQREVVGVDAGALDVLEAPEGWGRREREKREK
jgi:hypothetical protein